MKKHASNAKGDTIEDVQDDSVDYVISLLFNLEMAMQFLVHDIAIANATNISWCRPTRLIFIYELKMVVQYLAGEQRAAVDAADTKAPVDTDLTNHPTVLKTFKAATQRTA